MISGWLQKMRPGAAVNGRGEVTGPCVFLSAGIFPMCRDPAGPMSSDGELGLGPLPAVAAAAPEVTPVERFSLSFFLFE